MASITVQEYIRKKALGILGLIDSEINPTTREERLTFVNDIQEAVVNKLHEYNVWYTGDADELLNFYTRAIAIDYNSDPILNRNKKSYFWSVSSTEQDIKRTHSGQPRNISDTLVNIIGLPRVGVGKPNGPLDTVHEKLQTILEENNFAKLLMQKARPLTLIEGWGAWKINWDKDLSDTPILLYYRAEAVDFIFRSGRLVAIIYKDYYQDEKGKNYILFEIRRQEKGNLIIEKELFETTPNTNVIKPMELKDLKQLKDVKPKIQISNYRGFLGYPCIYFDDNNDDCPGRSIFTGKIDLFDDLDQCLSQSANTVRRSTTIEYFDAMYLEKDENTGLPKMPHSFDRKYVSYKGARSGDGLLQGTGPVTATQPQVNFEQYSTEATNILLQIISGIMSPATLGIDVAKKDNAEAQREKEKVTIFTRNTVMSEESKIIKIIANDLLCANEMMHNQGKITTHHYDVYVQYDEFADASFEKKLETVLMGWREGMISDKMAVDYLYGDSISKDRKDEEVKFMENQRQQAQQSPFEQGEFGELGAENEHNEENALLQAPNTAI